MGGPEYDFLENPLGAVRQTFEKAAAAEGTGALSFDPASFDRKDWGAVDLFHKFLFEQDGLSHVPILDRAALQWIRPNSLVRFRGMVQDVFGNELYIGAFKDGSKWRTNKYTDVPMFPMSETSETRLWERRLLYCVPVPGQNSWTLESTCSQPPRNLMNSCTSHHGEKRRRDDTNMMDSNVADQEQMNLPCCSKKQREDEHHCQSSQSVLGSMVQDGQSKMSMVNCFDANPPSCLVKIYDAPENDLKLNDVIEFIGIYTFDPEVAVHKDDSEPNDLSFDFMEDFSVHLPPTKVPRLHCLIHRKLAFQDLLVVSHMTELVPNLVRGIRESLLRHLTDVMGNDGLAANCLLLHLLSRVHARVDVIAVGKLSLNLTGLTRESASIFGNQLIASFKSILPFSKDIPLTVEYLNTTTLQPRKDNETGRMVYGVLQLAPGSHLVIDETHLYSGTLNSVGVENVRLLKHLMQCQMVEYDFEYYKLEMPADVQVLVLSEGMSNILPADLVLPFRPTVVSTTVNASPEELQSWRWYLATLRSTPHSIEPEMQKMLENDLVAARKEDGSLRAEDLSRLLTMAQLMSASFGETRLSMEHWQMVLELERLRKERLIK